MHTEQWCWHAHERWDRPLPATPDRNIDLLLIFGTTAALDNTELIASLRRSFPEALLFGCSSAGEIHDVRVYDHTLVATAVSFETTRIHGEKVSLAEGLSSRRAGQDLARALTADDLAHVLVLSDGLNVNGSELIAGLLETLPQGVSLSGGLASDAENLGHTLVLFDDTTARRHVGAVGLYGDRLRVGSGSLGGWDPFGPERKITRSDGNVLYELDGQPALDLYKKYLGERAAELPESALLFPLSLHNKEGVRGLVRTVLAIDEEAGSLIFAGDVPEGARAKLMKANFERLIDGAMGAARISTSTSTETTPALALLISCVGRKLVLQQRIEEEVEAVRDVLGERPALTGFYSLGEISPFTPDGRCELHNQTMTVTTFAEA
ncbi:MAG: FIST N-terminal domain-containing protein [Acidobacteriota bacterium]